MAVRLSEPASLAPVAGVRLGVAAANIRYRDRVDLALLAFDAGTVVSGVFTQNAFCAAPVVVAREHLRSGAGVRALLINSGNANAGTGQPGIEAARRSCQALSEILQISAEAVLPFSTGVIGEALPVERLSAALPAVCAALSDDWLPAARAIMTTDTVAKGASRIVQTAQGPVTVTGIAKGSGMIRPDMATMLAFVACDARLAQPALDALLKRATDASFNRITVDGDTSTNDALVLAATGQVGDRELEPGQNDFDLVEAAVTSVCEELAQAIVRDGEGATKLLTIEVQDAADEAEAALVAYTVAHSPLVKTAAFAGDPNWGRILAAVGRAGVQGLDVSRVDLFLDDLCLLRHGEPDPDYIEARAAEIAAQVEVTVRIALGRGSAAVRIWTCDLSYDYVRINAEYRS